MSSATFAEVVSENSYFDDLGDSIKRLVLITYIAVVVKICLCKLSQIFVDFFNICLEKSSCI